MIYSKGENETIFEGKDFVVFRNIDGEQFKIVFDEVGDECFCSLYKWSLNGWLNVVDDNGSKSEVVERLKNLSSLFPTQPVSGRSRPDTGLR